MKRTAEDYLNVWRSWIGYSESNGKYKEIIDIYNREKPLPRGYKVNDQDAWCDVTVSAAAIKAGMTDLIGRECSCEEHVKIFREKRIWIEDGTIIPKPGYLIVYNWNDRTQPNNGFSDHIGVVEYVDGNKLVCIEGNYNNSVMRREIPVGWGYIRGYAAPEYENVSDSKEMVHPGESSKDYGNAEIPKGDKEHFQLSKEVSWKGIVKVNSWLNVRTWAGTSYETCSFSPLYNGTVVEVCDSIRDEKGNVWYYIKYKEKYGFVHGDYIGKLED